MKKSEYSRLTPGLYRLHWNPRCGGGSSLAAVGITPDGGRWMAPANWVSAPDQTRCDGLWKAVCRAELLEKV